MYYDSVFENLITVVFNIIPQLGGLGPKSQDSVIPFCLDEVESLKYFHLRALAIKSDVDITCMHFPSAWVPHLRALAIKSELIFMRHKIGHSNNLTEKYIIEISKLKHLKQYMTSLEINFIIFKHQPQSDQLSIIFTPSI